MFSSVNIVLISLLLSAVFSPVAHAQLKSSPSFKMDGQGTLLSNFVHRGLTQTEADPALQGSFLFSFGPQFALGLWGSNVNYPEGGQHLWLKINAEVKIPFTDNFKTSLKYAQNQFYKTATRNGNTIGLHFDAFEYLIAYEIESNWEGRGKGSTHVSFGKNFPVWTDWTWENMVGYNMIKADGYSNYFHIQTFIGKPFSSLNVSGGATMTTPSSQFNGRGDLFLLLRIAVPF